MLSQKARAGNSPFPYLRNVDVQWNHVNTSNLPVMNFDAREASKFELLPGDVLVCEGGEPGRAAVWPGTATPCYYQKALHRLRRRTSEVLPEFYVAWAYVAFRENGEHDFRGAKTTIAHLPAVRLAELTMPLPPLEEQQMIVALLSRIRAPTHAQSSLVAALTELKAATMSKLFREGLRGGPLKQTPIGEMPEGWGEVTLGSIVDIINYGTSAPCSVEPRGLPVLRIPNVIRGGIDISDLKYGNFSKADVARYSLAVDDLLFVRTNGNRNYTGRCAVFEGQPLGALFASYLIRVRIHQQDFDPRFVQSYLSFTGREQLTSNANPAADGKYNIDTGTLKRVVLPRPSLDEQRSIVHIASELDARIVAARAESRILTELFETTLSELMSDSALAERLSELFATAAGSV